MASDDDRIPVELIDISGDDPLAPTDVRPRPRENRRRWWHRITRGRHVQRGLTWKSSAVALAVILGGMVLLSFVLRQVQTPEVVEARVAATAVVEDDTGCAWAIDVEVHNPNDRRMTVTAARLADVDGSQHAIVMSIPPHETETRTYRYPLADCATDPSSLGATELEVDYRPSGSSFNRTVTIPIG